MFDLNYEQKKRTDDPGNLAPITFQSLSVTNSGGGVVTLSWTTGQMCSSLVRYGVSPNLDQKTAEFDTSPLVTSHSVQLTGLVVGKIYLYRVESRYGGGKDGMNGSVMDGYVFGMGGSFVA